ncbi:MAG: transmembrane anchor protein [Chloroflexota bacterium]
MNNNNRPTNSELPSVAKLIKSTITAITLAAIVLLTAVLPAEYGIDPTGVGKLLGLTKMGEIKVSLAQEAVAGESNEMVKESTDTDTPKLIAKSPKKTKATQSKTPLRTDEMTFTLVPNQGYEIKVAMKKGKKVNYVWWTNSGRANFDVHGDSAKLRINYHNYYKGSTDRKDGSVEAAFDGKHGWFWRNRTSKTMTITLQVEGEYSDISREG